MTAADPGCGGSGACALSCSLSLFLFLSLISGGPFWNLLYFIVLGGVFGGWGRKKSLFSWGLSVPSETFTKVMFSCCGIAPNLLWALGGWSQVGAWATVPCQPVLKRLVPKVGAGGGSSSLGAGDWPQLGVN